MPLFGRMDAGERLPDRAVSPAAHGPPRESVASPWMRGRPPSLRGLLSFVLSGHVAAAGETAAWVADPVTRVDPGGAPPRR